MSIAIVWLRRDLRLADNPALRAALEAHEQVLPVFIHHAPDEEQPWSSGAATNWWLHHSLKALAQSIAQAGGSLILRAGDTLAELRSLVKSTGATAVYWNRLYEPAVIARDRQIKQALREDGLIAESRNAALWFEPWELQTGGKEPYRVFTPFWRNAEGRLREQLAQGRAPLAAVRKLKSLAKPAESLALEDLQLLPKIGWDQHFYTAWTPGESGAQAQLGRFLKAPVGSYLAQRDLPAVDAVSQLSPHLHFGEISPMQIAAAIEQLLAENHAAGVRKNAEGFLRQIAWREFGHHLLFHFPQTPTAPLNPRFAEFEWRSKNAYASDLRAWQRGETGIPIVDAGMRQLWQTGWMHNRVRMLVASVLTKNLLIPWTEGAAWFWDTLVDADLANNTLGWQWVAGCGADAAPYFRIFNPVLQGFKFDSAGDYVRRWVPELAQLPASAIHAPWDAEQQVLQHAGIKLGSDYPNPIVDLRETRARALEAYDRVKK